MMAWEMYPDSVCLEKERAESEAYKYRTAFCRASEFILKLLEQKRIKVSEMSLDLQKEFYAINESYFDHRRSDYEYDFSKIEQARKQYLGNNEVLKEFDLIIAKLQDLPMQNLLYRDYGIAGFEVFWEKYIK